MKSRILQYKKRKSHTSASKYTTGSPHRRRCRARSPSNIPFIRGLDLGDVACPPPVSSATCGREKEPLAFIVAGEARGFLQNGTHLAYKRHVLDSFGVHASKHLFLYLKHDDSNANELGAVASNLRPARMKVVPPQSFEQPLPDGICRPPVGSWKHAAYQARAMRYWSTLEAAWNMVLDFEAQHSLRFGGVFLSRPDLQFERDFGPRCMYDVNTWYTGGLGGPDWLWLMPRHVASAALTSASVFSKCMSGSACCDMQHKAHRDGMAKDKRHEDDWVFSYWIMRYWTLQLGVNVSTRVRGHAHLLAQPPPDASKPYAHVGCGARNCGRYAWCLDEWKDSHFGQVV